MSPIEPGILLARIMALLAHYRQEPMPPEVERALAADWVDDLGQFPRWALDHACRAWRRDPKRYRFRPLPGRRATLLNGRLTVRTPDGAAERREIRGVDAYRDMGYLPAAMRNYLLRLGWAHGDDEIISTEQAIAWFDLDAIGRSPSRFDFAKLGNLNGHYLRQAEDAALAREILPRVENQLGAAVSATGADRLLRAMPGLKPRAKIKAMASIGSEPLIMLTGPEFVAAWQAIPGRHRECDVPSEIGRAHV